MQKSILIPIENAGQNQYAFGLNQLSKSFIRRRRLVFELARREITDRYSGQILGPGWLIGQNLIMIAIYVFLFGYILKIKVSPDLGKFDYTTYLLSGLIPWLVLLDSLNRASSAITNHANLVKQLVFPIEILPLKTVGASLFPLCITLPLVLIYAFAYAGSLSWTVGLLPVVIFFQILFMLGFTFALSAVGVFVKDIKELVLVFNMVVPYLIPIFYLPESVPEKLRFILYLNPLSHLVWCYQDAIFFGRIEHTVSWVVIAVVGPLVFLLGFWVFSRLKPNFGNAL